MLVHFRHRRNMVAMLSRRLDYRQIGQVGLRHTEQVALGMVAAQLSQLR